MNLNVSDWNGLWKRIGAQGDPAPHFSRIASAYDEPHRHYHNAEHISECLFELQNVTTPLTNREEIEMALWLHDVVYDPTKVDNEERSAEIARDICYAGELPASFQENVAALIFATRHNAPADGLSAQVVVDIDLTILGKPEERFWRYEADVRKEYSWVPENVFRSRRAEILDAFLSRSPIYQIDFFKNRYEALARKNLAESIQRLRS